MDAWRSFAGCMGQCSKGPNGMYSVSWLRFSFSEAVCLGKVWREGQGHQQAEQIWSLDHQLQACMAFLGSGKLTEMLGDVIQGPKLSWTQQDMCDRVYYKARFKHTARGILDFKASDAEIEAVKRSGFALDELQARVQDSVGICLRPETLFKADFTITLF